MKKQALPTLAFLDVETTGLSPAYNDRICEIAVLRCSGRTNTEWQSLINPQCPISPGAGAVNGITDAMVADAPLFPDVAAKVLEMIDGAVLICHNASFDISFLTCELNRAGIDLPDLRVIDTLRLARQHFSFPSNSLGNIADYLDIQVREQHRAMGDVRTTHQVFLHFHEELVRQGLTDIEALISSYKVLPARTENKSIAGLPPQLEEAMRSGRDINLWYVSRDGYETQRIVKPLRIVSSFDYLYLEAFCEIRHERRTFRLDRVVKMELVA